MNSVTTLASDFPQKTAIAAATMATLFLFASMSAVAQGSSVKPHVFVESSKKPVVKMNLSWAHPKDGQVSHFILERSFDGENFIEAALVFTSDDNPMGSYNYADRLLPLSEGSVHYRLKIVDMKGNYHYSPTTIVSSASAKDGAAMVIKI